MRHGIDVTVATLREGNTPEISATLVDLAGQAVPGSALYSLTLTYYQEYTQAIINNRLAQNVLQTNGVTVDSSGLLVWKMSVLDTVILTDALETEPHVANFTFSYPDGAATLVGGLTLRIPIANIQRN